MEEAWLVDVVFDMQYAKVLCVVVVNLIGQAKQNLVFGLVSQEINMVNNLIPPIEKSSPQIFAPHKKCGVSSSALQYEH